MWIIAQSKELTVNMDLVQSIDIQRVKYKPTGSYYYVFSDDYDAAILESPVGDSEEGYYIYGKYPTIEKAREILADLMQARRNHQEDYVMP